MKYSNNGTENSVKFKRMSSRTTEMRRRMRRMGRR